MSNSCCEVNHSAKLQISWVGLSTTKTNQTLLPWFQAPWLHQVFSMTKTLEAEKKLFNFPLPGTSASFVTTVICILGWISMNKFESYQLTRTGCEPSSLVILVRIQNNSWEVVNFFGVREWWGTWHENARTREADLQSVLSLWGREKCVFGLSWSEVPEGNVDWSLFGLYFKS